MNKMNKKWTISLMGGVLVVLVAVLVFVGMKGCEVETTVEPSSNIVPPSKEWFFENSDTISYVEVLEVDKGIKAPTEPLPPGIKTVFDKQHAEVKFLKVLKGEKALENTITNITKEKGYFYLIEKEKLVLYLRKEGASYSTISSFKGEWRLASALAEINSLKKDIQSGIVVGLLNNGSSKDLKVHVLQGRHKAPVVLGSEIYKNTLVKTEKIDKFDIAEIPLKPGSYTVLIEPEGSLYSFNRLIDGYYPYVILEKSNTSNWRSIYFDLNNIR